MSLSDVLFSQLGKALWTLESLAPDLDELLFPRQASSGENAGKPPTRGKSKPPLDVSMLDLKLGIERCVRRWSVQLRVDDPSVGRVPSSERGLVVLASWLRERLPELEVMSWAQLAAEEIVSVVRSLEDVVSPPARENDPEPIESGSIPEVVSWARLMGRRVSVATAYRWVHAGVLPTSRGQGGSMVVRLDDVLACAGRKLF